jgi:predicted DNA-binding transcriptional regulator AlpA
MALNTLRSIRAIKAKTVAEITGDSVRTVWRRSQEDATFPKPFKLSPQSTVWDESEVIAWLESKKAQRVAA